MRLIDDLMEPFRPVIDLKVWQLRRNGEDTITPDSKRAMVRTLYDDMQTTSGATPVMVCAASGSSACRTLAMPKSSSLGTPSCVTRMFEGLMSRCTTRC